MNLLIIVIIFLFVVLLTALFVITKRVKKGKANYVRENYSFKCVTLLIGLAVDIIAFFAAEWSPWSLLASLLDLDTAEPPAVLMLTRILAVIVFLLCAFMVYHVHNHWNGEISRRQYRINTYEMNDSGLILDFTVFLGSLLRHNYELKKHQKFSDDESPEKSSITNELPWHVEFAKIYSLMSNQAQIDPNDDWHALGHCFISSYADNQKIAAYCSLTMPTVKETKQFLNYIQQLLNITVRRSRQSGVARATCPD